MASPALQEIAALLENLDPDERDEVRRMLDAQESQSWVPTDEQRELIQRRFNDLKTGRVKSLSWDEVKAGMAETRRKLRSA